jgi:AraC-like DNA-binding protein
MDAEQNSAGKTRMPHGPGHPPRPLRPAVFTTRDLPRERQFGAWRDQFSGLVEMIAPLSEVPGYDASHRVWQMGGMALSVLRAPGATWRRDAAQIRRDALDHWVIGLSRGGGHTLRSAARQAAAPEGIPFVFSLHEELDGWRGDMDWVKLFVARDQFPEFGPAIDGALMAPLDGPLGRLLGTHLEELAQQLPRMTEADLPRAAEATRAMVAACVTGGPAALEAAGERIEQARLARLKAIIRRNLGSATLGPRRLCQLGEVSRSQLYRLFTPLGGVARYIQAERLRQARRAIADAGDRREIARIAESLGFYDASSFSRAFRREFGVTPRDLRAAAQAGQYGLPPRQGATTGAFMDILRRL